MTRAQHSDLLQALKREHLPGLGSRHTQGTLINPTEVAKSERKAESMASVQAYETRNSPD